MDINTLTLKKSLKHLSKYLGSEEKLEIQRFLKLQTIESSDVDAIVKFLLREIVKPALSDVIGANFHQFLVVFVNQLIENSNDDFECYKRNVVCISKLIPFNRDILRYTYDYFAKHGEPFRTPDEGYVPPKKKQQFDQTVCKASHMDVAKACLQLLKVDEIFFRDIWDWSAFYDIYLNTGCNQQKFITNQILAILNNMNTKQIKKLNSDIPLAITSYEDTLKIDGDDNFEESVDEVGLVRWNFSSKQITSVEGVVLAVHNKINMKIFGKSEKIVLVESTKVNLRSIALGISAGKAICVVGPVGCGKTSLIEHLAKITGRITPKNSNRAEQQTVTDERTCEGFLRIQLGDQTDGKMLLGQYRCTDVPGEFVWQPGVLTLAVMHGSWILLEDLDSATQDVCTIFTNLLENKFLSVPGFREHIQIQPGFQIFFTLRTKKICSGFGGGTSATKSFFSILEKHLYIINMIALTRDELSTIICANFPNLSAISMRIVDVFLTFSSGCHDFAQQTNGVERSELPTKAGSRLVSTRDLLKLCERSYSKFNLTSTECAYAVFQNSVDLFCSHLPDGDVKTSLMIEIGGRLGIIESRCVFLANQYKPEIHVDDTTIKIGRVEVKKRDENNEDSVGDKDEDEHVDFELPPAKKRKLNNKTNFSFTRVSACLLERISVSVLQNEPILLVGETGVGKTSSIQFLSQVTNHKLVVINMNNQSDVSDLLGGFKPVDLSFVIQPLRNEFESIFKKTFNVHKNEKFLRNISTLCAQAEYSLLIKLMLRICDRFTDVNEKVVSKVRERWQILQMKLLKMKTQMDKKLLNTSFSFIAGSLVNCIRDGDWILLDEINLASIETLECLSTILEPDGSVVLLEKGDYTPVKRHPNFRIFGCMNPSTDIGKKDLPVGIRNRFTEFFVDELNDESDLTILVGDYLKSTGIQPSKVHNVVKLYQKLRNLAVLNLNDGLGNRPVYSLRTLCRALIICAKNLCGSIDRNLYESFCLAFLTQLDPASHSVVIGLIQTTLLANPKAVLSQGIPQPTNRDFLSLEGYWIEKGSKKLEMCENYILTNSVRMNLKDSSRIISIGKLPILLQGPTSAGKTSLIEYVAKRTGNYCMRINNHEHTDLQEYIGSYTTDVSGKLTFKEGVLVQAMKFGHWIILDELNLAPSDILEALNRVLDDNRELFIPETQTLIKAHPNFMLFATQNPPGLYGGRKTLSRAFKNRFIELHFSEIPRNELEIILEKRCLIPKSYAVKMVKTMSELQINRKSTQIKNNFTLRDLFRWGNRYTYADKILLDDNLYDWNQHLVDEGYLVLSSKMRNQIETVVIEEALYHNFRKKINLTHLFGLHVDTSRVTRKILEQLLVHKSIVWTLNMRRMGVLIGKGLQFNEPILLVGLTGAGKTTICQIIAESMGQKLRILNCHMHTEGGDFLGGLRPYRGNDDTTTNKQGNQQLFEWVDGPLINCMIEGNMFLADEISLAEDSVLERLNCILEPERTVLLSEKGGLDDNEEIVIRAHHGFQFLATMNPGGDFGKKELSPALRNRFTEIWCHTTETQDELVEIAHNFLKVTDLKTTTVIAKIMIEAVFHLRSMLDKFTFSIRDILAWVTYITSNLMKSNSTLSLTECLFYGYETIFLDCLEMLPHESYQKIVEVKEECLRFLTDNYCKHIDRKFNYNDCIKKKAGTNLVVTETSFGIHPFFIDCAPSSEFHNPSVDFIFSATTTQNNLFRLLSALTLDKAILLEGPPGVGKTTLVENLAQSIGYNIVRINLCEHTDLADLFGTDLPQDDEDFLEMDQSNFGSFKWRDGPLLSALKAENTWILLDELNLAPQSVLEGLNAILDHRGEVYIPELNKTFKLGKKTRIFSTQNPLRQGGGRKGLPQSFLNRFTKVYLRKLTKDDFLHVINWRYGEFFDKYEKMFGGLDLATKMVNFSDTLEQGIMNHEFGTRGGPYEVNLRDILRWCDFLTNSQTGFVDPTTSDLDRDEFHLILYEKMKLVYLARMRCESDHAFIRATFERIFSHNIDLLETRSTDISIYWTNDKIYLGNLILDKCDDHFKNMKQNNSVSPILLSSQIERLKYIAECVIREKPVILSGPTDSGKTKSIDQFCQMMNLSCGTDTIDDSVTGSFQQVDLNRHLEEISTVVETAYIGIIQKIILELKENPMGKKTMISLNQKLSRYKSTTKESKDFVSAADMPTELKIFRNRLIALDDLLDAMLPILPELRSAKSTLASLSHIITKSETLNTCGHFEWVNSKIVNSLTNGNLLCLEHVNFTSSAILDRLNSILEPNGKLLISEKGTTGNSNESEVVTKHSNFRIFLTLDPKNGEISRAMRNRCIEINFTQENYTRLDLMKMIYNVGVTQSKLIDAIVAIHFGIKKLSEFCPFGVSSILKFSFLVEQNLKVMTSVRRAIQTSALEVYVRSSNVDLLGFGLDFFHNKMLAVIDQEISQIMTHHEDGASENIDLENTIVHVNEMTSLNFVKVQCETFLTFLKYGNSVNFKKIITRLFDLDVCPKLDINLKYLLYILYEICSDDYDLRHIYLTKSINKAENSNSLRQLNDQLRCDIANSGIVLSSIPWNSKIYPRIREYATNGRVPAETQLKMSIILLARTILNSIDQFSATKTNQIDFLTYSKNVDHGLMSDSLNNNLIKNLYQFLVGFEEFIIASMKISGVQIDLDIYVNFTCALLWNNRILECCRQKIFHNKKLDENLFDKLILHFKWMHKFCLRFILEYHPKNSNYIKIVEKIFDVVERSLSTPIGMLQKMYLKRFVAFTPLYTDKQVKLQLLKNEYNERVCLFTYGTDIKKFLTNFKNTLNLTEIRTKMMTIDQIDDDTIDKDIAEIQSTLLTVSNQPARSDTDPVCFLNVYEFFALKGLNMIQNGCPMSQKLNVDFYRAIPTINYELLKIIEDYQKPESKCVEQNYQKIMSMFVENVAGEQVVDVFNDRDIFSQDSYKQMWMLKRNITQLVQNFELNSILTRTDVINVDWTAGALVENSTKGAILCRLIMATMLKQDGTMKSAGLGEIDVWRQSLAMARALIWNNMTTIQYSMSFEYLNLENAINLSSKLLCEIKNLKGVIGKPTLNEINADYLDNFESLINLLRHHVQTAVNKESNVDKLIDSRAHQHYLSSLLTSIYGSIEINLLNYFPVVDPVEKNRLKKIYIEDDEEHIVNLLSTYDYMRLAVNYRELGHEVYDRLKVKKHELMSRKIKCSQKVAIRPNSCRYLELTKDIKHFLTTCCHPKALHNLIVRSKECIENGVEKMTNTSLEKYLLNCDEVLNMIELLINNILRFESHTLVKYNVYYRDFVAPLEYSLSTLQFGFIGIKNCLIRSRDSVRLNPKVQKYDTLLERMASFPSIIHIPPDDDTLMCALNHLESNPEHQYFKIIKSNLIDLKNELILGSSAIENQNFQLLVQILNVFNNIWNQQEESHAKKKAEDESLYVTKTKCTDENEDLVEQQNIAKIFPNYVEEDFGDYIPIYSLEKRDRVVQNGGDTPMKPIAQESLDVIPEEEFKFICESFMFLMNKFSRPFYFNSNTTSSKETTIVKSDYVKSFQIKLSVFQTLFHKLHTTLTSQIDDHVYMSFGLMVALSQQNHGDLEFYKEYDVSYNIYKDSNIREVIVCLDILKKIKTRTCKELDQWPDHATLIDIIRVIEKIMSLPSNSPIIRFSAGMQILRQKLDEWNQVAHRQNNMKYEECQVAEIIQKWTKMELQFWRECLNQSYDKVKQKAYRYWFFIYNVVHEYLEKTPTKEAVNNLKKMFDASTMNEPGVEFDENELVDDGGIKSNDLINILKQFMENANYADFNLRMRILKSFELYLNLWQNHQPASKRVETLIAVFHNMFLFYEQFRLEIDEHSKLIRAPIEKKLKDFVKIESYNKDLSYFSMKNNILHVHRNLHKFLKEYEELIAGKITPILAYKSNLVKEMVEDHEEKGRQLRYEAKVKYYMVEVKNFMASSKLKDKYQLPSGITTSSTLLPKIEKHFMISRDIVKDSILHAEYPSLIYNLDMLLYDHLELCNHLQKLEVDRNQERPKQVSQAKGILNQKKKAIADLFKTLSSLGLSYKKGLLEISLNRELTNLKIAPFCAKTILSGVGHKKHDQNVIFLNENLSLYYFKCVFKLKILLNTLVQPNPEVGMQNCDRFKGFAIDMFLLVQNQREVVSKSLRNLYELRTAIARLRELGDWISIEGQNNVSFAMFAQQNSAYKRSLIKICSALDQILLLLDTVPDDDMPDHTLLKETSFSKKSKLFEYVQLTCKNIQNLASKSIEVINSTTIFDPKSELVKKQFDAVQKELFIFKTVLSEEKTVQLSILYSINSLIENLDNVIIDSATKTDYDLNHSYENDLDNIIHSILISIQTLYKKNLGNPTTKYDYPEENDGNVEDDSNHVETIFDNHLKTRITGNINDDLKLLNIDRIVKKLIEIIAAVQHVVKIDAHAREFIRKFVSLLPILEQFGLLNEYYINQQFGAHRVSTKLLSIMLTVFIEIGSKGFCIPADLMQDADGEQKQKQESKGDGFGLEDGEGENDVSDRIENEDQLDEAKKPGEEKHQDENDNKECKEEKGIDMSEDFDAKMQDVDKDDDEESNKSEEDEDLDKQMGETEEGADKLDEQIWGDDNKDEEEDENNEGEMNKEENGKGSNEIDEKHNDFKDSEKQENGSNNEQESGLDAADQNNETRKERKEEIDHMDEPELDEEQTNPHHGELEEPPEPEEFNLDDNLNVDGDEKNENDQMDGETENPFDIDDMKDQMESTEDGDKDGEEEKDKEESQDGQHEEKGDKADDPEFGNEDKNDLPEEGETVDEEDQRVIPPNDDEEEEDVNPQIPDEDVNKEDNDDNKENDGLTNREDFHESKDPHSKEENIQAMPENMSKGTSDQVEVEKDREQQINGDELEEQDTGEDKEGMGQAQNEQSETGHQGVADYKDSKTKNLPQTKNENKLQTKPEASNEDRTLSDAPKKENKRLKTIDKLNTNQNEENDEDGADEEGDAEEYQHVKQPISNDKTTLDSATEEQSKKAKHEEEADNDENDGETDELMKIDNDDDNKEDEDLELIDKLDSEKIEQLSKKNSKVPSKNEAIQENDENEKTEIEGETVTTYLTRRGYETTAHTMLEILSDPIQAVEPTALESLRMRQLVEQERSSTMLVSHDPIVFNLWQEITNKMSGNARELCEQLRLILEPTKCTRLKGDYRTGRRINMRKIIPYIASQFRKDKIWLRRTKPAQRDYKITIAIDDSKSMDHNQSKYLTLEAISLVSQALTLLESGKLNIISFGESPKIILNYHEQFDGLKLVKSLNFEQNQSRIADLLDFIRVMNLEDVGSSGSNGLFENLLLIVSDGRNIFSEGDQRVKNAIKLARLQRIFIIYVIIDNPENKHSILDIRVPKFSTDGKSIQMMSYLDGFPFSYYVIVRDLGQLPVVLSEAMRQWFELVNSEQ